MRPSTLAFAALLLLLGASPPPSLEQARSLESVGRWEEALSVYRSLVARPGAPRLEALEAQEGTARSLLHLRMFDEALEVYRRTLDLANETMKTEPSPALSRQGYRISLRLGDWGSALRFCESLLPETCGAEDRAWAVEQASYCLARQQEWERLKEFVPRYRDLLPEGQSRAGLDLLLARALVQCGDRPGAEAVYRKVSAAFPGTPLALTADRRLAALQAASQAVPCSVPLDPERLGKALSLLVRPDGGVSGFRLGKTPEGGYVLTMIRPETPPQEVQVASVQDLEARIPEVYAAYRRTEGAAALPEAETPAYLGIQFQPLPMDVARFAGLPPSTPGLLVTDVNPGSPAEEAGLRKGDLLLTVNGTPVDLFNVRAVVHAIEAGNTATLEILRVRTERAKVDVRTRPSP